jgi:hypothetical protein
MRHAWTLPVVSPGRRRLIGDFHVNMIVMSGGAAPLKAEYRRPDGKARRQVGLDEDTIDAKTDALAKQPFERRPGSLVVQH